MCINFVIIRGVTTMELIDVITSKENLNRAYKKVAANKGAGGVDGMKVEGTWCIHQRKQRRNCSINQKPNLYAQTSTKSLYSER